MSPRQCGTERFNILSKIVEDHRNAEEARPNQRRGRKK
jgi:hypothetical protein